MKISYCCMKNMGYIIFSHNKQCLQLCNKNYGWNCRKNETCPLDNKCLTRNTNYKVQITNNTKDEHKKYLGATETSFKETTTLETTTLEILTIKTIWNLPNFQNMFWFYNIFLQKQLFIWALQNRYPGNSFKGQR